MARFDPEPCSHPSFTRFAEPPGLSCGTQSLRSCAQPADIGAERGVALSIPAASAFSQRGQEQGTGGVTWLPPANVLQTGGRGQEWGGASLDLKGEQVLSGR